MRYVFYESLKDSFSNVLWHKWLISPDMNSEKIGACFSSASFSSGFRMHHFSAVVEAKASPSFRLLYKNKNKDTESGGEESGEEGRCSGVLFVF